MVLFSNYLWCCQSPVQISAISEYVWFKLNFVVLQSNEVGSSSAMEKEGLIRAINELSSAGISISELITDAYPSIRKIIRENYSTIKHSFDVWHLEKSKIQYVI